MPTMVVRLLSGFLLALIPFFFNGSYNVIIDLLNALITALSNSGIAVIDLFPPNPCGSMIASCGDVVGQIKQVDPTLWNFCLKVLAWLLPIDFIVDVVGCALLSCMIFFTMAPVARWFKLIT